jgi:DNA-binding response OmpR family regulator
MVWLPHHTFREKRMKRILVVEDEEKIRRIYSRLLREEGFEVMETSSVDVAYDMINRKKVDLVLLDIRLPEVEGNILHEMLEYSNIKTNVIVASIYPVEVQKRLIPQADDYFDKSQGLAVLLEKIKKSFLIRN